MLITVTGALAAQQFPEKKGAVNDLADVLSPAVQQRIETLARELQRKTGAAVVIATLSTIGNNDYTDYANRLYEHWGIGEKGKDNGVLIMVVTDIRKLRIEVGYGIEHIITDGTAGAIRDRYMVPFLSKDDYEQGISNGFAAVAGLIAEDAGVTLTGVSDIRPVSTRDERSGSKLLYLLVMFFIFMLLGRGRGRGGILPLLLMGSMMSGGGRSWGGGGFGGGFGGGGGGFGGFGGGLSGGGGAGGGF